MYKLSCLLLYGIEEFIRECIYDTDINIKDMYCNGKEMVVSIHDVTSDTNSIHIILLVDGEKLNIKEELEPNYLYSASYFKCINKLTRSKSLNMNYKVFSPNGISIFVKLDINRTNAYKKLASISDYLVDDVTNLFNTFIKMANNKKLPYEEIDTNYLNDINVRIRITCIKECDSYNLYKFNIYLSINSFIIVPIEKDIHLEDISDEYSCKKLKSNLVYIYKEKMANELRKFLDSLIKFPLS